MGEGMDRAQDALQTGQLIFRKDLRKIEQKKKFPVREGAFLEVRNVR